MSRQPDSSSFSLGSCQTLDEGLKHVQERSALDLEEEEADLVKRLEERAKVTSVYFSNLPCITCS